MAKLYTKNYLGITMVLGDFPKTDNYHKGEGFINEAKSKLKLGYVCDRESGSPKPKYVILVPALHRKDCHVRKALAEMSYSKGDMLTI